MKRLLYSILFFFICTGATGQDQLVDSLRGIITSNQVPDTSRVLGKILLSEKLFHNNQDSAMLLVRQAIKESKSLNFKRGLGRAHSLKGLLQAFDNTSEANKSTRIDSALVDYLIGERFAKSTHDSLNMVNTQLYMGYLYQSQDDYRNALKYLFEALYIAEKMGYQQQIPSVANSIAMIYASQLNHRKSLEYYFIAAKALKGLKTKKVIQREMPAKWVLGNIYMNIGDTYVLMNDLKKGLDYFEKSVMLADEIDSDWLRGLGYPKIAEVYAAQENPEKGIEIAQRALKYQKRFKIKEGISVIIPEEALSYMVLGWCYRLMENYAKAIEFGKKSIAITDGEGLQLSYYNKALKQLYLTYEAKGDYKKALETHKHFKLIQDSIFNTNNTKQIALLEAENSYKREKDSLKIVQEKQMIEFQESSRTKQNVQLGVFISLCILLLSGTVFYIFKRKISEKKKIVLLRQKISQDLHDEIGSNLSSIALYGTVASASLEKDPNKTAELLNVINSNASKTIESMNDIVWTINSANDKMSDLISRMRSYAVEIRESGSCDIHVTCDPQLMDTKLNMMQRRNLYFIFKEAIDNTIKHSETNSINVVFKSHQNNKITFEINDKGKGFNPEILKEKISEIKGNGIKNMKMRAEELESKFNIKSIPGDGTHIILNFEIG